MGRPRKLIIFGIVELVLTAIIIWSDYLVPTVFILVVVALSLFVRKEHLVSLGFKRPDNWWGMVCKVFGLMVLWTVFILAVVAPILNHVFGLQQDISTFANLKGNVGMMVGLLVVSWVLAALSEETVYRGFVHTRARELFGRYNWNYAAGAIVSAMFFGLAHTEQGLAGVVITFFDAIYFSLIRRHFNDNLWAAVLAHGISNTIGIVGFFILGPIRYFW